MPHALLLRGFAARLGLATSVLIAITCIAQSWILARRDLSHIQGYLTDRGRTIGEYLGHEAGADIVAGNLDDLRQLAEQARAQNGVGYCRFFDRHGLLLVSIGNPPGSPAPLQGGEQEVAGPIDVGGGVWEFQAPAFALEARPARERRPLTAQGLVARPRRGEPGERVGTVAIGISVASLGELRRQTLATATLFTTLCTLVAVLGALLLARAITRPLKALSTAADALARGDFGAKVQLGARDELGDLARSFNSMAESLGRSRAQLEEYSRALEGKVSELQEANRLKSEFLATVSHELRTPLNVIVGYAEMLAEGGGGTVSAQQSAMLATIKRYAKLQLDLIENVLDFSRLTSGQPSLQIERFALAPLLSEIQTLYRGRLRGPGVHLTVTVGPGLPELETDRIKLETIVRNLVDNAVKFTEEGIISVVARPGSAGGWLTIEVADTGIGMSSEDTRYIFDAFRQLGESNTRHTSGVGLGLSIVKRLVDALGGTVCVSSRAGEGSTFRVDLPCRPPETDDMAAALGALDGVTRNVATLPERGAEVTRGRRETA